MRKGLKRFVSWILCCITMCTFLVPLIEVLNVEAAEGIEVLYYGDYGCKDPYDDNRFYPRDAENHIISIFDFESTDVIDMTYKESVRNTIIPYLQSIDVDYDNTLASTRMKDGLVLSDFLEDKIFIFGRYYCTKNAGGVGVCMSFCHMGLYDRSSNKCITVVMSFGGHTNVYAYCYVASSSGFLDSSLKHQCVNGNIIDESRFTDEKYNSKALNSFDLNQKEVIPRLLGECFDTSTLGADIAECMSNTSSVDTKYYTLDNLFNVDTNYDGNVLLEIKILGYVDAAVSWNMTVNGEWYVDRISVGTLLCSDGSILKVNGSVRPTGMGALLDIKNTEYIEFGDSGTILYKPDFIHVDLLDYDAYKDYIEIDSNEIGLKVADIVQASIGAVQIIAQTQDVLYPYDVYKERLSNFSNSLRYCNNGNDCVLSIILDTFGEAMRESADGLAIANAQQYISNNTLIGISSGSSDYEICNAIIGYNIQLMSEGRFDNFNRKILETESDDKIYITTTRISESPYDGTKTFWSCWDNLSDYQRDLLITQYRAIVDLRHLNLSTIRMGIYADEHITGHYTSESASEFAELVGYSSLIEGVQGTIESFNDNLKDTFSIYNIVRNCNSLGQYLVGVNLYGENGDGNIYSIYNATLSSLSRDLAFHYEQEDINTAWYPNVLPDRIPLFGDNTKYYTVMMMTNDSWNSFYDLLYCVSYGFEVAAFSEGAENRYDPDTLVNYFKNGYTSDGDTSDEGLSWLTSGLDTLAISSDFDCNGDEFSKNMLISIIELHDLCEFLGMLDDNGDLTVKWTTAIETYINIYNTYTPFFDALRSNPNFFKTAPTSAQTVDEPLGMFFNIGEKKMSDYWCMGFAASSLFVPMETNVYDATSISYITDSEFITGFYYKYAFYRKALYISTDNSAIVNAKVSGSRSGTRVCTLNDLLNYDRDIILYVDDNFYNAGGISEVTGRLDYSAVRNGAPVNTDDSAWDSLKNWIGDSFELSPEQILKTGSNNYYSTTLAQYATKLGGEPDLTSRVVDVYLLSQDALLGTGDERSVFEDYEYSVKIPYAVVSSVYRDADLYNECLRALSVDNAIFKSSIGICSTPGSNSSDWRSIYNYCMLMNLSEQMKNDSASTLDLNAPVFCDIFGNIITESGLVIIPAAANATLCGDKWNPNTVGWSEYYNNGAHLTTGMFSDEVYEWLTGVEYNSSGSINGASDEYNYTGLTTGSYTGGVNHNNGGGYFTVDRSGDLILRTSEVSGRSAQAIIQWENLNKNSEIIKELFFNDAYYNKAASGDIYSKILVNMVVETMRGAPIEFIDYTYEGLSGNTDISKLGVYMAYKLEELTDALVSGTNGNALGGNSVVTMPNLALVTGVEYVMLYLFKIAFAIMIVGLAISLYLDAVKNHLGLKSVGKFLVTCIMVIVSITLIPNLISWSYYKANKTLLTEESAYIMMLNYVKEFDGSEIGITSVTTPETTTELYLKVDNIDVKWWEVIGTVLFSNTCQTVSDLYRSQLEDNAMALQPCVQMKGDGLYVNVQDVYNSTDVVYYPSQHSLQNVAYSNSGTTGTQAVDDTVVSFNMPYYVFLDKLVASINEYNASKDISAYSYSVGSNGHIMTYDIISPYLTSSEFLDEGYDILALNEILETGVNLTSYTGGMFSGSTYWDGNGTYVNEGSIGQMKNSRWYPTGSTQDDLTQNRINELYAYARNWIGKNSNLLGKVPDEVFIKVFAMELAIKYNQIWGIHTADSIEIMNIDTRDLARLIVTDRASVYKYYSYSFSRFVYEEAGTIGVVFAAIYFVILWVASLIKPALMLIILFLLVINVLGRKILFKKESRCIEGYLIGAACLVGCNYIYALMLKLTLSVAQSGFGSVMGLVMAIVIQILYVVGLCFICAIEMKDWRNNGYNEFVTIGSQITSGLVRASNMITDKIVARYNTAYNDSRQSRRYMADNYNRESVEDMLERDAEREDNAMNTI